MMIVIDMNSAASHTLVDDIKSKTAKNERIKELTNELYKHY